MRNAKRFLLLTFLVAAACGGGKKSSTTEGVTTTDEGGGDEPDDGENSNMCPPEVLDSVQQTLLRRRASVARCLTEAVNAGTAPKNARGSVLLSFVIGTNGKARDVAVTKSTIKNEGVERCVISKIEEIEFESCPSDLDWSHTYAFESN